MLQEIASPGIVAGRAKRRSDDTTTPATRELNAARAKPRPWRNKVRLKKCKGDSQYARRKRAGAKGGRSATQKVRLKKCDAKVRRGDVDERNRKRARDEIFFGRDDLKRARDVLKRPSDEIFFWGSADIRLQ